MTYLPSCKPFKKDEQEMLATATEVKTMFLSLAYEHTSVGQPSKTYIHQLSADTGCRLEDLPNP